MKKLMILAVLLIFSQEVLRAQFTYNGSEKERIVKSGKGQEFNIPFIFIEDFHFVQFAVYPADVSVSKLRAPNAGQVWLIYHAASRVKGKYGALYIVKPFSSPDEARRAVDYFERRGISCWYNADLTGVTFDLLGTTVDTFTER